jgi:hypothetical protein
MRTGNPRQSRSLLWRRNTSQWRRTRRWDGSPTRLRVQNLGYGRAMTRLEDLTAGAVVRGVVPGEAVTVVASRWAGTRSVVLTFRTDAGKVDEQVVYRTQETELSLDGRGSAWSFDGDPALFRLVAEARRIRLAYLFDPRLAVHLSLIEPLPHQIIAVYGEMLPRQPLRFCLADDPGANRAMSPRATPPRAVHRHQRALSRQTAQDRRAHHNQ